MLGGHCACAGAWRMGPGGGGGGCLDGGEGKSEYVSKLRLLSRDESRNGSVRGELRHSVGLGLGGGFEDGIWGGEGVM